MDSACDVGHLVNALAKRPFDALVFGCDMVWLVCVSNLSSFFLLTFADSPILGLSPESSGLPCPHCRQTRILAISVLRISKARIVSIQTLLYMLLSHVLNLLGVRTLVQPWLIHRFSIRVLVGHSAKLERLRIRSFQQANTHTYVTYVTYVILVWHLHDLHVYPATLASVNLQKRGLCLKISVLSVLVVAWLSLVKQDVFRSWWILDQALIWSGSPLVLAQMQPCKMQWTAERLEQKQPQQPKQHVECYHINRI